MEASSDKEALENAQEAQVVLRSLPKKLIVRMDGPLPKESRAGPVYRLPRIQQGELLHKLYAVAHFKAESSRATMEGRKIDLQAASEKLDVDVFKWGRPPKNVLVIWSHRVPDEGTREYELAELSYKSLR